MNTNWLKRSWLSTEENGETYGDPHISGMNDTINIAQNRKQSEKDCKEIKDNKSTRL